MNLTMDTIDIVVSDLDAAIAFYRRLGLDFTIDSQTPEHAGCDLPNGLHLMLDTQKFTGQVRPGWVPPVGGPPVYLCFRVDTPADVDRTYAELTGAGYQGSREPWDAFWGMRYATVLDPDGNGVDLYAASASSSKDDPR